MKIEFTINGLAKTMDIDPGQRLLDFIRNDLKLTGAKEGCSEGECGACTIIVDGKAVTSCTMLAGQINGCTLLTIEGLAQNGELDLIQQAFIEKGAIQCGFCSPGMIMSVKALLLSNPHPDELQIRRAIEGNLCRCTGYQKIVEAVNQLSEVRS